MNPSVHFPTVILPTVLVIIIMIPLCCLVKRALTFNNMLQSRVSNKAANDHELTPPQG